MIKKPKKNAFKSPVAKDLTPNHSKTTPKNKDIKCKNCGGSVYPMNINKGVKLK